MALQLQSVTDPGAVLDLIAILQSAPGGLTRDCVLTALGEKLKDPRAVPGLAAHLPDPAPSASYRTLDRTAVLLLCSRWFRAELGGLSKREWNDLARNPPALVAGQ